MLNDTRVRQGSLNNNAYEHSVASTGLDMKSVSKSY